MAYLATFILGAVIGIMIFAIILSICYMGKDD